MFNTIKKYDEADSMSRRVNGLRTDLQSGRVKDATQLKKISMVLDKITVDIEKLRTLNGVEKIDEYVNIAHDLDHSLCHLDTEINGTLRQQFERAEEEAIANGSYKDPFAEN